MEYSNRRSLAALPVDLLAQVTKYLRWSTILEKLRGTGDPILWRNIQFGGAKEVDMSRGFSMRDWSLAQGLSKLTTIKLADESHKLSSETGLRWIKELPSTLMHIEIESDKPDLIWLSPATSTTLGPQSFLVESNGYVPINMSTKFPSLRVLLLKTKVTSPFLLHLGPGTRVVWTPLMSWYWLCNLPPTITRLVTTHTFAAGYILESLSSSEPHTQVIPSEVPEGVSVSSSNQRTFHEIPLPPNLTFLAHASLLRYVSVSTTRFPPSLMSSMRDLSWGVATGGPEAYNNFEPRLPIMPTPDELAEFSFISSNMHNLRRLSFIGDVGRRSRTDSALPSKLRTLPLSLTRLSLKLVRIAHYDVGWMKTLPETLTRLTIRGLSQPVQIPVLPQLGFLSLSFDHHSAVDIGILFNERGSYPNLTAFTLRSFGKHVKGLSKLPTAITRLKFDGPLVRYEVPCLASLALQRLHLNDLVSISDEYANNLAVLPMQSWPNLRWLALPACPLLDVDCKRYLPPSLEYLHARMVITGRAGFDIAAEEDSSGVVMDTAKMLSVAKKCLPELVRDSHRLYLLQGGLTHENKRLTSVPSIPCIINLKVPLPAATAVISWTADVTSDAAEIPFGLGHTLRIPSACSIHTLHLPSCNWSHSMHFPDTLTSLKLCRLQTKYIDLRLFPLRQLSLCEDTIDHHLATYLPTSLTSLSARCLQNDSVLDCFGPNLSHLSISKFELRDKLVPKLPPSLTHLECSVVRVSNGPVFAAAVDRSTTSLGVDPDIRLAAGHFSRTVDLRIESRQPWASTKVIIDWNQLPTTLTTLAYPTVASTNNRPVASKTLPRNSRPLAPFPPLLTMLDLTGVSSSFPRYLVKLLPRTLTSLTVSGVDFTIEAFSQLPRGLKRLSLTRITVLRPRYLIEMPPQLEELSVDCCVRIFDSIIGHLPRSIRILSFPSSTRLTLKGLRNLPPSIEHLRLLDHGLCVEDLTHLPSTLRSLRPLPFSLKDDRVSPTAGALLLTAVESYHSCS